MLQGLARPNMKAGLILVTHRDELPRARAEFVYRRRQERGCGQQPSNRSLCRNFSHNYYWDLSIPH